MGAMDAVVRSDFAKQKGGNLKTLRLLLFSACNRDCDQCCNKDWDLKALPIERDFTQYDEVLLTGGEPMLSPRRVWEAVEHIRAQNTTAKIHLYTAMVRPVLVDLLRHNLDGVTLTLHDQNDVTETLYAFLAIAPRLQPAKSLRLNVFEGVVVEDVEGWQVKRNMVWLPQCPLPANETFCRADWRKA